MTVALDTNIVMEILQDRRRLDQVVAAYERHAANGSKLVISVLTLSTVFYLAESNHVSLSATEAHLKSYKVYDVLAEDATWALQHYKQDDFEDALQVAAALREGCTTYMTLDTKLASKYKKHLSIELIH